MFINLDLIKCFALPSRVTETHALFEWVDCGAVWASLNRLTFIAPTRRVGKWVEKHYFIIRENVGRPQCFFFLKFLVCN